MVRPDILISRALLIAILFSLAGCAGMKPRPDYLAMSHQAEKAYRAGDYAKAEHLCQEILKAVPATPSARFMLGNIYARTGRLHEATSAYRHVLDHGGNQSKVWYNLGVVYAQQAIAAFTQAGTHAGQDRTLNQKAQLRAHAMLSSLQGQSCQ
ncbi:MAG: tetratricopeptide repeat protein [Gammaproteobacteria bacterium]|jgi:Flp pilus assembly protein TadD